MKPEDEAPQPTQLQLAFSELETKKSELRNLKTTLKDILADYPGYTEAKAEARSWAKKAKLIQSQAEQANEQLMSQIDAKKADVKGTQEKLDSLAFNKLTSGETVEVRDSDDVPCVPEFKVKFRKVSEV